MQNVDNTVLAGVMVPSAGYQRSVVPMVRVSQTEDTASTISAATSSTVRVFGAPKQRPAYGPNRGTMVSSISGVTEVSQAQPPEYGGRDLGVEPRDVQLSGSVRQTPGRVLSASSARLENEFFR